MAFPDGTANSSTGATTSTGTAKPAWWTRLGFHQIVGKRNQSTNLTLTLMALPGIALLFVFAYLPMLGLVIAFKDYKFAEGIFGSAWVGFENFRFLFGTDNALAHHA